MAEKADGGKMVIEPTDFILIHAGAMLFAVILFSVIRYIFKP